MMDIVEEVDDCIPISPESIRDLPWLSDSQEELTPEEVCLRLADIYGRASVHFDGKDLSVEAREMANLREHGVNETIAGVREVFNQDVMSDWYGYSPAQRAEKFNQVAEVAANALGISEVSVVFERLESCEGYNRGDGIVHLSDRFLNRPELFLLGIDTVVHETRHQFQRDALKDPERFGLTDKIIREWAIARATYTSNGISASDPVAYSYNPLENDSEDFARSVTREIASLFNEMRHGEKLSVRIDRT